jgi:Tol biopolymer transport system component
VERARLVDRIATELAATSITDRTKLVDRGYGPDAVDPSLEKTSWLADGSGFIFVGNIEVPRGTQTVTTSAILSFDMSTGNSGLLVVSEGDDRVRNATIAPDGSAIVYCLSHDGVLDLRGIDLTLDTPEDVPLTDDGKSCSPGF